MASPQYRIESCEEKNFFWSYFWLVQQQRSNWGTISRSLHTSRHNLCTSWYHSHLVDTRSDCHEVATSAKLPRIRYWVGWHVSAVNSAPLSFTTNALWRFLETVAKAFQNYPSLVIAETFFRADSETECLASHFRTALGARIFSWNASRICGGSRCARMLKILTSKKTQDD